MIYHPSLINGDNNLWIFNNLLCILLSITHTQGFETLGVWRKRTHEEEENKGKRGSLLDLSLSVFFIYKYYTLFHCLNNRYSNLSWGRTYWVLGQLLLLGWEDEKL